MTTIMRPSDVVWSEGYDAFTEGKPETAVDRVKPEFRPAWIEGYRQAAIDQEDPEPETE